MAIYRYDLPQTDVKPFQLACDILSAHHSLIAGATGCGKSTLLETVLYAGHLHAPCVNQFIYCDLKRVELIAWKDMPHCMGYASDAGVFCSILDQVIDLMDDRLDEMVANHQKQSTRNHIYIVVDETAELLQDEPKRAYNLLCKILRLGRCANIHAILCTQSPKRDKSCGGLPAGLQQNITYSVALHCASAIESRQIIGVKGAEKLPKHGQALVLHDGELEPVGVGMQAKEDVEALQAFWKRHPGQKIA